MIVAGFEIPDMGDIASQMSEAAAALPGQMEELGEAMESFGEQHEENVASLAGNPDWTVEADIAVGKVLHAVVTAEFDLAKIIQAQESTQSDDFTDAVQQAAGDLDDETMAQVMEQLGQGRSIAVVTKVEVKECSIAGAPGDATKKVKLSPESNIPLAVKDGKLTLEFAPLLTIKNDWENADIPTFEPMADEIAVPLKSFDAGKAFTEKCSVSGQDTALTIGMSFTKKSQRDSGEDGTWESQAS